MNRLALRERRLIALGILVLLIALAWFALVRPVLAGFDAREEERQRLLLTYARGERVIGAMRATRAAIRSQHLAAADYAIEAPSAALATDLLRERVVALARAQKATVASVQETQAPPGSVAVRADFTLPTERVGPLLAAVQNDRPWLIVEQFGVTADRALETARSAPVDVRLDLSVRFDAARSQR